jgi:hypothetical protein
MKNSARHALVFGLILLACAMFAHGQSFGPYSLTGTQCAAVRVTQRGTATYQVTGSWSGTIQPQVSVAEQPAVNAQATPANSTTAQATITANGAYFTGVSGYSTFLLCGNTITGTASVYLNISTAGH